MIYKLVLSSMIASALSFSGCSIAGQWEATGQAGDFQLARATFNEDKTYESTAQYRGHSHTSTGKYSFNGMNLTLTPDDGSPQRSYGASLGLGGKTLKVTHKQDGKSVTATMTKVGCCKCCTNGACPCCKGHS
jgi:hypothetical protein